VRPSIPRPVKELKDFAKVFLKKGESKKVSMTFSVREATSYWNEYKNKWCSEKGDYEVLVGTSSADTPLKDKFTIESTEYWLGL
jgi:beta-glucosidase